jgi:PAS domain S-box-containing protein
MGRNVTKESGNDAAQNEMALLIEAFERFTGAGESVTRAYEELTIKVDELNLQLEEKNRELAANLAEKERLSVYLRNVLESLGSAVFVVGRQGKIEMTNLAAGKLLEADRQDLIGRSFVEVLDGPAKPAEIPAELISGGEKFREREFEFHVDGRELKILRAGSHPLLGAESVGGRIVRLDDITEETIGRAQVERTERLAAMGEMAVKIVHEVRNPMGSIELVASLLARDLADWPEKRKLVYKISSGIQSMDHIISNLLAFARNTQPTLRELKIHSILDECLSYNVHLLEGQSIAVETQYSEDISGMRGDPELLKQVFMNLIINAAQSMPKGGRLTLAAKLKNLRNFETDELTPFMQVQVADTGVGMTPEIVSRLFNPFFTTKDRGTGLGLALSHNIVKAHTGHIDVDSTPGQGSAFTVNLPINPKAANGGERL